MIRISQIIHGRGTVSGKMGGGALQSDDSAPSRRRGPVIFWNITARCNLACKHCYQKSGPGLSAESELKREEALRLIEDLASIRVPVLLISGGEPLLREDFWDLAGHARSMGINTALSTNGTLVTGDIAQRIKDAGIDYVGVSLDGATEKTHDALRGVAGSYRRSVAALENCVRTGLPCGVRVTATRDNWREIPALIDLSHRIGIQRFCVYWLVPSGRGRDIHTAQQVDSKAVTFILDTLYRAARDTDPEEMEFLTVDAPQDAVYFLERLREDDPGRYPDAEATLRLTAGCSAGNRVANIDPFGNVYPCQFAQMQEFLIGNVKDRSFLEIWNDPSNPVLTVFRHMEQSVNGTCGSCSSREICGLGCRVRAYADSCNFSAEDPLCPRLARE
ncbi:MAG TPA: radical SAM protein [Methanomicrobiales archaeon]|nr:radical SAM protein [Methanomicrobiales archaeon]